MQNLLYFLVLNQIIANKRLFIVLCYSVDMFPLNGHALVVYMCDKYCVLSLRLWGWSWTIDFPEHSPAGHFVPLL